MVPFFNLKRNFPLELRPPFPAPFLVRRVKPPFPLYVGFFATPLPPSLDPLKAPGLGTLSPSVSTFLGWRFLANLVKGGMSMSFDKNIYACSVFPPPYNLSNSPQDLFLFKFTGHPTCSGFSVFCEVSIFLPSFSPIYTAQRPDFSPFSNNRRFYITTLPPF